MKNERGIFGTEHDEDESEKGSKKKSSSDNSRFAKDLGGLFARPEVGEPVSGKNERPRPRHPLVGVEVALPRTAAPASAEAGKAEKPVGKKGGSAELPEQTAAEDVSAEADRHGRADTDPRLTPGEVDAWEQRLEELKSNHLYGGETVRTNVEGEVRLHSAATGDAGDTPEGVIYRLADAEQPPADDGAPSETLPDAVNPGAEGRPPVPLQRVSTETLPSSVEPADVPMHHQQPGPQPSQGPSVPPEVSVGPGTGSDGEAPLPSAGGGSDGGELPPPGPPLPPEAPPPFGEPSEPEPGPGYGPAAASAVRRPEPAEAYRHYMRQHDLPRSPGERFVTHDELEQESDANRRSATDSALFAVLLAGVWGRRKRKQLEHSVNTRFRNIDRQSRQQQRNDRTERYEQTRQRTAAREAQQRLDARLAAAEGALAAEQANRPPQTPEQPGVTGRLDVPAEHQLRTSAWHSIEVDARTGRAVEQPAFTYGEEYHHERAAETVGSQQDAANGTLGAAAGTPAGASAAGPAGLPSDGTGLPGSPAGLTSVPHVPNATMQGPPSTSTPASDAPSSVPPDRPAAGQSAAPVWPWLLALLAVAICLVVVLS